jgi:hypothetical protein
VEKFSKSFPINWKFESVSKRLENLQHVWSGMKEYFVCVGYLLNVDSFETTRRIFFINFLRIRFLYGFFNERFERKLISFF